ncbi:PulJ/GspJ family protein [Hydrogenobacter hydrogenophilus]|uniref:N-terminal methylation motif-containing protein n=1 Tax=Hydrogenobacter hydrogenophilus TaxID=35835 RepID=A0A285NW35_9AQUI|nr:prepilin-type N-terminal cleavage/methylation domain-containing protein [Hydrogenobacter hydrogenophilus]SNZ12106.1 N-terminal methylation motif-containing protein [Hydrogenobacter hydrogenophilus]
MLGRNNAFTLIELLISVAISTLVVLGLVSVYGSVQEVRKRFEEYDQKRRLYELVFLLQKELSNCRELELQGDTLRYYTTFGISAPYVMVSLQAQKDAITYTESNPYDPSIVYLKRHLRAPGSPELRFDSAKNIVSLFYDGKRIDLLVQYNRVPTSSIFLRPF